MSQAPHNPKQTTAARDWVLVVDDDEPITLLLSRALTTAEVEVVAAASGAEALQALDQRGTDPVMVVTDVMMPGGMDGLTLARKLASRLARSKVVVMSGHLSNASFWPADLREVAFLAKPFAMSELIDLLATARAEYHARR